MSKYGKDYQICKEEEGMYHEREYRTSSPASSRRNNSNKYQVEKLHRDTSDEDEDNFQEWTTSKRKVNHKTRQVETRVSRQLLVEDGRVIADSGPQVTTRIKEDNKVEECEREKAPKDRSKFDALKNAPESEYSSGRVLGEKKEIQRVSREVREENMQYHDERFKELTGQDVHRRAIQAPHELITITDKEHHSHPPRGKMVHYSNKGKKYQDTDEILEVAKLAIDGSITKEVKRTKHHEEFSDDEKPDEKGEADALRKKPIATRSSRRHFDYVNDFDDTSTPSESSDDDEVHKSRAGKTHSGGARMSSHRSPTRSHSAREDAFPRYERDPLLNSLRDEDFRPINGSNLRDNGRYVDHPLRRKEDSSSDSSDIEHNQYNHSKNNSRNHQYSEQHRYHHQRNRSQSPQSIRSGKYQTSGGAVEIPEEYRVNKQKIMSSRSDKPRDRSFSPAPKSHLSQRSSKSHRSQRREDASVQARLTDEEEEERKSMRSLSSDVHSHERAAKQLERQSTIKSRRNYYYGSGKDNNTKSSRARASSVSSKSSCSSIGDTTKEKLREYGARSKDSGFRSPDSVERMGTPMSGKDKHIYSTSSKSKMRDQATSPTPSYGQRSVKTTTTTFSGGLTERPHSRQGRSSDKDRHASKRDKSSDSNTKVYAMTIRVPYRQVSDIEKQERDDEDNAIRELESGANIENDIENLRKRLDNINGQSKNIKMNIEPNRYDYQTVVANLQPINTYNMEILHQDSPFKSKDANKSSTYSVVGTELASSGLGSSAHSTTNGSFLENNNEANFCINQFINQKTNGESHNNDNNEDQDSVVSFNSLKSSKTYHIGRSVSQVDEQDLGEQDFGEQDRDGASEAIEIDMKQQELDYLESNDEKRPRAWIFDPDNGSSTAIMTPPKPKDPELKVTPVTEELAESRGGRSYYLGLIETVPKVDEIKERVEPIKAQPTRWKSVCALTNNAPIKRSINNINDRSLLAKSSNKLNVPVRNERIPFKSSQNILALDRSHGSSQKGEPTREKKYDNNGNCFTTSMGSLNQLNRSKSSSSLIPSSLKPTKYSIYGGLRQKDDQRKHVPRLSYSRAIGPRSQRPSGQTVKTAPSRYLKIR